MSWNITINTDYGHGYSDGRYLNLYCTQSQNVNDNTSTIYWCLSAVGGSVSYYSTGPTSVVINGTTVYYSGRVDWSSRTFPAAKGSVTSSTTVPHNSDGTKSISVSVTTAVEVFATQTYSATWSLETIPRASAPTVDVNNITLNDILTISTNRHSSNFTHNLLYSTDDSTFTLFATGIGSSYAWTVPYDIASSFPNSTSGTLYIKCRTYNGTNYIGSNKINITINIPDNSTTKPSIDTIPIVEGNALKPSAFNTVFVQSLSDLTVTPTASGKYSATIVDCETTILDVPYIHTVTSGTIDSITSATINTSGTINVSVTVTDSRGYSNTSTTTVAIVPYSEPSITSLTATQVNGKITAIISGLVSSVSNLNTATLTLQYKSVEATTYNTTTVTLTNPYNFNETKEINISGLLAGTPYVIVATLEDENTSVSSLINTNLSVDITKARSGYIAIPINGKIYDCDYMQTVSASSWDSGTDVDAPSTLNGMKLDNELNIVVGYTTDKYITHSPINYKTTWARDSVNEFIVDINTVFNKVFCLGESNLYYYTANGSSYTLSSLALPALSSGDVWKFIVGNDYRLYIISQNGIIYYRGIADNTWHQTRFVPNVGTYSGNAKTPTSLAPISSGKFYATPNSLVALLNTVTGWGFYRTPTISYR